MELRSLRYFVAVAEERHFRRAAARLHMTQPPLSRAIRQLETDLGTVLLNRSSTGVSLTPAGAALYDEARVLLEQAEQVRVRVAGAAGAAALTVGVLGDSAIRAGSGLAAAFRELHPAVQVRIREADLTDPTTGLRAGLVDVALTRAPFDDTGISTRLLRTDSVGVVLRNDDPLARHDSVSLSELTGRRWLQLPADADPLWRAYWNSATAAAESQDVREIRTGQECQQGALWNGAIGLSTLDLPVAEGLTCVPLVGMPPSRLVVAWNSDDPNPLIRSFARIAASTISATRQRA